MSPLPVITITGSVGYAFFSSGSHSIALPSGSFRSSIIALNRSDEMAVFASPRLGVLWWHTRSSQDSARSRTTRLRRPQQEKFVLSHLSQPVKKFWARTGFAAFRKTVPGIDKIRRVEAWSQRFVPPWRWHLLCRLFQMVRIQSLPDKVETRGKLYPH